MREREFWLRMECDDGHHCTKSHLFEKDRIVFETTDVIVVDVSVRSGMPMLACRRQTESKARLGMNLASQTPSANK